MSPILFPFLSTVVLTHQPSESSDSWDIETGAAIASIGKTSMVKQNIEIVARLIIIKAPQPLQMASLFQPIVSM
jgi:hypothetical protein